MEPGSDTRILQERFLAAYAICLSVARAAKAADIARGNHWIWMANDPTYKPRFDAARRDAIEAAEGECWRRAVEGVRRMKLHNGRPAKDDKGETIFETTYSDELLKFVLKGNDARYRDRLDARVSGPTGGALQVSVVNDDVRRAAAAAMADPKVAEALITVGEAMAGMAAAEAEKTRSDAE